MDSHAILLVIGGTVAAALIAFPIQRLLNLFHFILLGWLFKKEQRDLRVVRELIVTARVIETKSHESLFDLAKTNSGIHQFIREGYYLTAEGVLSEPDLLEVLKLRSGAFKKSHFSDAKILVSLSKFPPAFGLLGASTGMIAMMTNLGEGGPEAIGAAMAIALVATFWGIALANFVLLPLSDYALKIADDDATTRQIIIDGLMMIKRGEAPAVVARKLISTLPIHDRISYRKKFSGLETLNDKKAS